jgi:REP element-mobilizing transposase RayT
MNRGRSRTKIFNTPEDYLAFIELLKEASFLWKVKIAAYCLMSNHYHLLLQTPAANLSRCMRHINGIYTQYFNRSYKSDGPLFRGRYKSILIDEDKYLLELVRYIHRNPLSARLVKRLEDYRWTSHKAYISGSNEWNWLHKDFVLSMLEETMNKRHQSYIDFMKQTESETLKALYERSNPPLLLGAKDFIDEVRRKYGGKVIKEEMPQSRELVPDASEIKLAVIRFYKLDKLEADELLKTSRGNHNEARNVAIYLIRKYTGTALKDIGNCFGMNSYSSVGSVITRIKQEMIRNRNLRQKVEEVEKLLI